MGLDNVLQKLGLNKALSVGLQALGQNRKYLECEDPRVLTGSVDIDAEYKENQPNAARWDYGVGIQLKQTERIEWIEIHPASSGEVHAVLAKLEWLQKLLKQYNCQTLAEHKFHWIASGRVNIDTTHRRRLNNAGLKMPKQQLRIPSQ